MFEAAGVVHSHIGREAQERTEAVGRWSRFGSKIAAIETAGSAATKIVG
jgi:hypothetical protein